MTQCTQEGDQMKVLLLASLSKTKHGNIFGGAEKSIINLSNWLAGKGYDTILASVEGDEIPYHIDKGVKTEFATSVLRIRWEYILKLQKIQ